MFVHMYGTKDYIVLAFILVLGEVPPHLYMMDKSGA